MTIFEELHSRPMEDIYSMHYDITQTLLREAWAWVPRYEPVYYALKVVFRDVLSEYDYLHGEGLLGTPGAGGFCVYERQLSDFRQHWGGVYENFPKELSEKLLAFPGEFENQFGEGLADDWPLATLAEDLLEVVKAGLD